MDVLIANEASVTIANVLSDSDELLVQAAIDRVRLDPVSDSYALAVDEDLRLIKVGKLRLVFELRRDINTIVVLGIYRHQDVERQTKRLAPAKDKIEGYHVLFIDDDAKKLQSNAADCILELCANGWGVYITASWRYAIEHIATATELGTPEDVVVLDIMMPVDQDLGEEKVNPLEAGYYILRRHLRQLDSAYQSVPVLVLTNSDRNRVQRFVEGIDGVWVRHKSELPSFHLPSLLEDILQKPKETT